MSIEEKRTMLQQAHKELAEAEYIARLRWELAQGQLDLVNRRLRDLEGS